ncbi:hypothetical protein ACTFIZ_010978 [Dictyostelium cf. discoideum]
MDDVYLNVFQNDAQYYDCIGFWSNIRDLIQRENDDINNNQVPIKEILSSLNCYIYSSEIKKHFSEFVRRGWFFCRFQEINVVYFTLKYQLNNFNLNHQNLNALLDEIKTFRRLLIVKHYESLLVDESISLPTEADFTFNGIPFPFSENEINNWRDKNIIKIGRCLHWYEGMEGLMEMVETIAYQIIHSEETNFQI